MSFTLGDFLRQPLPPARPEPPKDDPARCPRTGKVRHRTRDAASAHVLDLRRNDDDGQSERLRPYRCYSCGDFHVGHTE